MIISSVAYINYGTAVSITMTDGSVWYDDTSRSSDTEIRQLLNTWLAAGGVITAYTPEVSTSVSANDTSNQITVYTEDTFSANDPVFIDYKTGRVCNMNDTFSAAAFTAGPYSAGTTATDPASSSPTSSNSVILSDDSIIFASLNYLSATSTTLILYKYDKAGNLLNKNVLAYYTTNTYLKLIMAKMTNGNIILAYFSSDSTIKWHIVSSSLNELYSGTFGASDIFNIQVMTNGGAVIFSSYGLNYISDTGTNTNIVSTTGLTPGIQDEIDKNVKYGDTSWNVGLVNYDPIKFSDGKLAYVYQKDNDTIYYILINADGTAAFTPINIGGSATISSLKYAYSQVSDNIMWCSTYSPSYTVIYGVISKAGTIVKTSTSLSTNVTDVYVNLITDTNSLFVAIISYPAGPYWRAYYFSTTGTIQASFPKNIGTYYTKGYITAISKLSTGTVFVMFSAAKTITYSFMDLSGNITINGGSLYTFKTDSSSVPQIQAFVHNDKVYGCASAWGNQDNYIVFSLSNSGGKNVSTVVSQKALDSTYSIRLLMENNDNNFNFVGTLSSTSYTLITNFDLLLKSYQTFSTSESGHLSSNKMKNFGYGLIANAFSYNIFTYIKPRATIFLGCAVESADVNGILKVNTSGFFSGISAFDNIATNFDHSSYSPMGNKGWINNGVIKLGGI